MAGSVVFLQALVTQEPAQSVGVFGDVALSLAAAPIALPDAGFRGIVVVTSGLDDTYLAARARPIQSEQDDVSMALVGRSGVLASAGSMIDADRQGVLEGKRVNVSVDFGGGR